MSQLSAFFKIRNLMLPVALFVLVALVFVLGEPAHADGWHPACAGPPPCSDTSDGYGGAETSLYHNYPSTGGPEQTTYGFNSNGQLSQIGIIAHEGGIQTSGIAVSDCTSPTFMSFFGCTSGPAGPQGRPKVCVGDPINIATGDLYEEATDFATHGQDALALVRSYNSDLNFVISKPSAFSSATAPWQSRFGVAWRNQFDSFIQDVSGLSSSSTQIDAIREDGNPVHFGLMSGIWYAKYWDAVANNWSPSTDPRHNVDLRLTTDGAYWYIQDQNDTIDKYDMTGKLVKITYRGGYYQTLTYDGSGNNTVVTDSFGRTLTFTYLANGLVDTMTDPSGGVTHYSYVDRSGISPAPPAGSTSGWILQSVQYPDGKTLTYLYEDNTNIINRFALTGITDENGNRFATWTYDATTGRATSSQHAGGADLTSISYDDVGNTRTLTNALGKQAIYNLATFQGEFQISSIAGQASAHCAAATVSYSYDTNGFTSQTTSGEGRVNTYTNNSIGQQTSRTEGYGTAVARTITTTWDSTWREPDETVQPNLTTDYTYDGSGRLSQLKQTDTTTTSVPYGTNGQTRIWAYTYYSSGLLNTVDGPLYGTGDTTTYAYDTNGCVSSVTDVLSHVTSIGSSNGWCEPLSSTDPNSIATNYAYDLRGRLTSVTINPGAGQAVYGLTYDYAGNLTVVTLPDSSTLTYGYDNAHRLTSVTNNLGETITYTLDALGDRTATVVKTTGGTITKQQTATFDELGRVMADLGAAAQTTSYTYDKDNNQVTTTDPRSKLYGHAFDALSRLYQETDPNSYQTTVAYNGKDEVTGVTDARSLVTSYVRDGFGDAISQASPDTGTTVFYYDANGKLTKQVDARSIETDFTNDVAGRVLTKTFPAASAENVTYTYDATASGNKGVGKLTSVSDQSGSTAFVYDALGHVTSNNRVVGSNSYSVAYTYDAAGSILTETYPSGRIVIYARDARGRISGVTTKQNSGASAVNVATSTTYAPFGPLKGFTFGNSAVAAFAYDQDYQLTGISAGPSGSIQNLTNGYDAAGNITTITDSLNTTRSQTLTYENLNRVASGAGVYGSQSYTYDGVGNRLTRVVGSTTDTYAYASGANRVSTVTTGSNVRSFTYAASGQVTQDVRDPSHTYTFAVNNNGRNASASLNGSTAGAYLYNGFEQRVQKTVGSTVTQFVFDSAGHLLEEANGSGTALREYIWLDNLPVAMVDDTGASPVTYYIHTDQLGTPQKISDGSANVVWDGVFDPFGNAVGASNWGSAKWGSFTWGGAVNTVSTLMRFPGQYFDAETALNQNWNRDYDSTIGRYIQSDPIGLNGGIDTYAYVEGNPLIFKDPPGLIRLPADPSGLPPNWTPDPSHQDPNGERWTNGDDVLDFNRGRPGLPGWRGKDHWHHNGGKEHLPPGAECPTSDDQKSDDAQSNDTTKRQMLNRSPPPWMWLLPLAAIPFPGNLLYGGL